MLKTVFMTIDTATISTCRLKNVLTSILGDQLLHFLMEVLLVTLGKPKGLKQGPTTQVKGMKSTIKNCSKTRTVGKM